MTLTRPGPPARGAFPIAERQHVQPGAIWRVPERQVRHISCSPPWEPQQQDSVALPRPLASPPHPPRAVVVQSPGPQAGAFFLRIGDSRTLTKSETRGRPTCRRHLGSTRLAGRAPDRPACAWRYEVSKPIRRHVRELARKSPAGAGPSRDRQPAYLCERIGALSLSRRRGPAQGGLARSTVCRVSPFTTTQPPRDPGTHRRRGHSRAACQPTDGG
jgi:hypothetical protein